MSSVAAAQTPVPSHLERTSRRFVLPYFCPIFVSAAMRVRTVSALDVFAPSTATRSRRPKHRSPTLRKHWAS
eukprot:30957-Pelagococcus_subviridis.AAC.83